VQDTEHRAKALLHQQTEDVYCPHNNNIRIFIPP